MSRLITLLAAAILALPFPADGSADEKLKELKAAYKAKDSTTAVRLFDQLLQDFAGYDAKTQEEVVKVVEGAFPTRRDEGDDVEQLFIGAGAALANMGANGGKALLRSLNVKHLKNKPRVVATLVEGLGQQEDPAMVDALLPYLRVDKALGVNWPVAEGAVRALGRYRAADGKLRKRVVGEMVLVLSDYDAKFAVEHKKPEPDAELETAFQKLEAPLLLSLRSLSGAQFESAADWNQWWTKAKDDDWTVVVEPPPRPSALPLGKDGGGKGGS